MARTINGFVCRIATPASQFFAGTIQTQTFSMVYPGDANNFVTRGTGWH
ncbi:hypothetical protein [Pukyongiella litopenaei]|nr:hypothetical protein [Pukyongiella litopenaei]